MTQKTTLKYEPAPDEIETVDELLSRIKRNSLSIKKVVKQNSKPTDMFIFDIRKIDLEKSCDWTILHEKCLLKEEKAQGKLGYVLERRDQLINPGTVCRRCGEQLNSALREKQVVDNKARRARRTLAYQAYIKEQILLGKM